MKNKRFNCRMTEKTYKMLKSLANLYSCTMSETIDDLIQTRHNQETPKKKRKKYKKD